jgi:hypothetical protein
VAQLGRMETWKSSRLRPQTATAANPNLQLIFALVVRAALA